MFRAASLLALAGLALAVPGQRAQVAPGAKQAIDGYLRRCAAHGWSGSFLVAAGGEVLLAGGYGFADREGKRKNDARTLFEIASTTKAFTGTAILRLEEMGRLSTDDLVSKHLPGVPAAFRDITVHHLLTHTSGMPRAGPSGSGDDLEAAVARYFSGRRARAAGLRHEYWNGGYALLAGIVERVSGETYVAFCREHLLEPAGMEGSGFTGDPRLDRKRMAIGYEGTRKVRAAGDHPYRTYGWQYRGMGGLVTSVTGLWRFDRALAAGRVLKERTLEKAYRTRAGSYACGWYVLRTRSGRRWISHGGDVRGFHTQYVRLPDHAGCIALTSNVEFLPMWVVANTVESLLFGDRPRQPRPPPVRPVKRETLEQLQGRYLADGKGTLVVSAGAGGLWIRGAGRSAELLPLRARPGARPPALVEIWAAPVGDGEFLRFGWGGGRALRFRFSGRGSQRTLVLEGGDGLGPVVFTLDG